MEKKFVLVIHGGAGTILKSQMTPENEKEHHKGLEESLSAGYTVLKNGGTAMDAVVAAVKSMEDNILFNAGRGSAYSHYGRIEMDASLMDGKTLKAGAVTGLLKTKNPIEVCKKVIENTEYVFISGDAAEKFAESHGLEMKDPAYFHSERRWKQLEKVRGQTEMFRDHNVVVKDDSQVQSKDEKTSPLDVKEKENEKEKEKPADEVDPYGGKDQKYSTVGAVALDVHGNLAAATSTGGLTNKKYGRIGDSPLIGAGNYANNKTCAVSCTGNGEYFIRSVAAYDVSALMEYKGLEVEKAAEYVIHEKVLPLGSDGGLIAVDAKGNIAMPLSSEGMYRGFVREDGKMKTYIYKDEQ